MAHRIITTVARTIGGIGAAIRARPKVFGAVALGVFAYTLVAPVIVLSIARKPVDHFTFNPWLSRLPEWLASRSFPDAKTGVSFTARDRVVQCG